MISSQTEGGPRELELYDIGVGVEPVSESTSKSEELVPVLVVLVGEFSSSVIFSQSSQSELNLHSRQLINAAQDREETRKPLLASISSFSLPSHFNGSNISLFYGKNLT